jgi:hypothetical protein
MESNPRELEATMREPWQERVLAEKRELDAKLEGLDKFIDHSDEFTGLGELAKSHLRSQRYYMRGYSVVLAQRIEAFAEAIQ